MTDQVQLRFEEIECLRIAWYELVEQRDFLGAFAAEGQYRKALRTLCEDAAQINGLMAGSAA